MSGKRVWKAVVNAQPRRRQWRRARPRRAAPRWRCARHRAPARRAVAPPRRPDARRARSPGSPGRRSGGTPTARSLHRVARAVTPCTSSSSVVTTPFTCGLQASVTRASLMRRPAARTRRRRGPRRRRRDASTTPAHLHPAEPRARSRAPARHARLHQLDGRSALHPTRSLSTHLRRVGVQHAGDSPARVWNVPQRRPATPRIAPARERCRA
jgi:hypothetical protein